IHARHPAGDRPSTSAPQSETPFAAMEATAGGQHDDGIPATSAERKEADARESELAQTQQQQQCEGDDDGDEVGSIGAEAESKDKGGVPPEGAEDMGGATANVTGKQDTTGGGHVGSDVGDDQDGEPAVKADQTASTTPEGKHEGPTVERATTDDMVVVDQMGTAGKPDPPLSPQQQQQQQQQHTSPAMDARGVRVGNTGNNAGGVGGTASSRGPSVPPAPIWPEYCDPMYRMPEELAVKVLVEGEVKEMSIKIERFEGKKVFQGGYRHRGTGRLFHHASTQFGQRERPVKNTDHLRTRDTQTCKIKTTTMQTTNECGTQMARKDMHLDDGCDTFKTAGEYQTAGEYWRVRERKTVTIQRFWRGFSARSRVWCRREEKWALEDKEMEEVAEEEGKRTQERQREMQRRMNPSTVQDFEVLYNELDQWRDAETKRIKQAEVGERRKLALRELLHKETRLLQTIDRLKITAAHEGKERRTRRMLELMSASKQWEMGDGEVSEIHTPWTNRARDLQDMYEALEAPLLSVEERLDVLLHLKWTVSEFDCRLTRDIAELVDREADLLSRGRGEASLRPLRQRIRNLFLRFAETPDFNPEASRFIRVPPKYGKLTDEGMAGLTGVVSCK
ncbi:unnamed protein product, partial [Ectocarpus fasciculatus]